MKNITTPFLLLMLLSACGPSEPANEKHESHRETPASAEVQKGPHGGRLLTDGDFTVELAIFESGVPPEFRAWIGQGLKPVPPSAVQLSVELGRLGGITDRIGFVAAGDYLRGDKTVTEPHSFDVKVTALHAGVTHEWSFASYEGRVTITAPVADDAGLKTAAVGPGAIVQSLDLYGSIVPDASRIREVKARFPGVVRRVLHQIGDRVRAGDPLATVESNESLRSYEVTAPIAGVVTKRQAEAGEQAQDEAMFEIVDLTRVWAEFNVFPRDRSKLREGMSVRVIAEGGVEAVGRLGYISPLSSADTQTVKARVTLDNAGSVWTPGQFVEGRVAISKTDVALMVPLSALQTFRDMQVVFARFGETYEVRMLELGRRDADHVEVLGGIAPGIPVVTENSYLVKADIEKSGASHDH